MKKSNRNLGRKSAFTLIEILVATTIMVIMVGLVVQITSEVLKVWNRSTGKLAANAEARIALELLTSDLENAIFRENGQQWLRVESETNVGTPIVGQTVGLKLFSPAVDAPDEPGDICAVAYRLAYSQAYTGASTQTFILYRSLEGPQNTFNQLLGPATGDPQLALTAGFWDNTNIVHPNNYLVSNVVDFKLFIYGETGGTEVVLNDADGNLTIDTDFIYGGTGASGNIPLYADIKLTVVSDEGLRILELPSLAGTGYAAPADVIREHGQVFARRVNFNSRPI